MSEAVIAAKIKAYDEFSSAFTKLTSELKNLEASEKSLANSTNKLNSSQSQVQGSADKTSQSMRRQKDASMELLTATAQLGMAYYTAKQMLGFFMEDGLKLEVQLKRVAAITKESAAEFKKLAQDSQSKMFGPAELATGFTDLAASGFNKEQIAKMYGDLENLAIAGMVDFQRAAESTTVVLKTWKIDVSETAHITDAFVKASNMSSLQIDDLNFALAMSSAAARLAGMDFEELLATLGVLRDAGLSASDAGTSIKSALLAMMNPSTEATDVMKALNIEIYDSQKKMKSWAEITKEFSTKTAGLDEQARNFALSTIAGSDGIRALSLSMNTGSAVIEKTTASLKAAKGEAKNTADQMSTGLAAALKEAKVEFENLKNMLYDDVAPAFEVVVRAAIDFIKWFKQLPGPMRIFIETLIGSAGALYALNMVTGAAKTLMSLNLAGSFVAAGTGATTAAGGVTVLSTALRSAYLPAVALAGALALAFSMRQANDKYNADIAKYGAGDGGDTRRFYPVPNKPRDDMRNRLAKESPEKLAAYDKTVAQANANFKAGQAAEVATKAQKEMDDAAKKSADTAKKSMAELQKEIDAMNKKGKKDKDKPDPFNDAMATFNYQKELQNMAVDAQIDGLKKIRDNFVKNGKWTLEQHRQIDTQIVQLTRQRVQEQLNYSRNWIETQKGLNKLSTQDEIAAWQRVKAKYKLSREEMAQIDVQIYQLQEQARKDQVDKAKAWIDEQVFYNKLSVAEQVQAWQDLRTKYKLNAEEIKEVDRQMYNLRKEQADKLVDVIRTQYEKERDLALKNLETERDEEEEALDDRAKAYEKFHDNRMKQLDKETDAQVKALQDQIDAVNNLNKQDEDTKKDAERNQKLGDLQTEYNKYKGATSAAGKKKLAEIEQEMADIQYEIQQEAIQKQREEQVGSLQAEIDRIKEQAEAKKTLWQEENDSYKESLNDERDALQRHYELEAESTRTHYEEMLTEQSLKAAAMKIMLELSQSDNITMLESKAPLYKAAGEILGQSLADGIKSKEQAVRDAAKTLASAASDYLELHSPAKKGPLSTLDEWFKPFGKTLADGMGIDPLVQRISDVLPKPSSGALAGVGGDIYIPITIENFNGTQENITQFWSEGKRVFDGALRSKGRRG